MRLLEALFVLLVAAAIVLNWVVHMNRSLRKLLGLIDPSDAQLEELRTFEEVVADVCVRVEPICVLRTIVVETLTRARRPRMNGGMNGHSAFQSDFHLFSFVANLSAHANAPSPLAHAR